MISGTQKKEQSKPKANRTKKIIRIIAHINKIENRKTIERTDGNNSCFFEKITKIGKPKAR